MVIDEDMKGIRNDAEIQTIKIHQSMFLAKDQHQSTILTPTYLYIIVSIFSK